MIAVKINDQKMSLPDKWEEVTTMQYMHMVRHSSDLNPVRLLSILIGMDYDTLQQVDSTGIDLSVLNMITFIGNDIDFKSLPVPDRIKIGEKEVDVPKDIRRETLGQKLMMQTFLNGLSERKAPIIEVIPFAIATYLSPGYYEKPYDDNRAQQLIPLIEQCPVMITHPLGYFFLNRWRMYVEQNLPSLN